MNSAIITIERMLYGGGGAAHVADATVIAPFTLPGETVEVALAEEDRSGKTEAPLLRVIEPVPARVTPACAHFGVCGGCQYQHADYRAQVDIKRDILLGMFQRAGIKSPQIQTHSSEPYKYRNRIQLRVERVDGVWQLGYNERASHRFMAASICPIASDSLWSVAEQLRNLMNTQHAFTTLRIREVELFCDETGSRVQMIVMLDVEHATLDRDAPKQFRQLCEHLQISSSVLHGAGLWVWAAAPAKRARGRAQQRLSIEVAAWGEPALPYRVEDKTFALGRGGFFQVNQSMLPTLLHLATDGARGAHAWDLYAGIGLFSSRLVSQFQHVTAVEIGERSHRGLASRLQSAGKQHLAFQLDTLDFLRKDAKRLPQPDFVIVDPPRSGLGGPVTRALAEARPREIRYVSCDPTTLTQDLKSLLESGYCLAELSLVDMFPQTFHMESVVRLTLT